MNNKELEEKIAPFFWVEDEDGASLCLNISGYKSELFEKRADEGFLGNGYDWESLAIVFMDERMPELVEIIDFDPESSMFAAYSVDKEALEKFAIEFKEACENDELITDLFSRAEID